MPGSTTHSFILYRALQQAAKKNGSPLFQKIFDSHAKAVQYAQVNDASGLAGDEACVLQGCAYLGSCGPDLFYLEMPWEDGAFIADLLHYNRTGPFIIRWLTDLRQFGSDFLTGDRPDMLRQLAYCLGHISHIAADITMHPLVNSVVGAYPENSKTFFDSRAVSTPLKQTAGMLIPVYNLFNPPQIPDYSVPKPIWKFHNKLEHFQDAYVLHHRFIDQEGFCKRRSFGADTACLNLALPTALRMYSAGGIRSLQAGWKWAKDLATGPAQVLPPIGIVGQTRYFYAYPGDLSSIENDKYGFFADKYMSGNYVMNVSHYYDATIPDRGEMERNPELVQRRSLDAYIDKAVALTIDMWDEVLGYVGDCKDEKAAYPRLSTQQAPPQGLARLSLEEIKKFPLLGRHWNLDCGLAPAVSYDGSGARDIEDWPDTRMHVPMTVRLESIHGVATMDDVSRTSPS